jgi:hypothetical protein
MKKRLRKRKKIRGGRAVFRSIMDPADGVTYWQGPDGVFRPLMRTQNVYFEVEEKVKRTLLDAARVRDVIRELDAIRERVRNPVDLSVTVEIDDGDPRGEQMRETFAAFKREIFKTLRERLPVDIYETLPDWAKTEAEPTP